LIIALDAMGGDHAPAEIIGGALLAQRDLGIEVALVGAKEVIEAELSRQQQTSAAFEIIHASEAISMTSIPRRPFVPRRMPRLTSR